MAKITLTIDNKKVEVEQGTTVLEAAKSIGINIPTLCYMKGLNEIGACRICVVEVQGARALQASCVTPVTDGMVVKTNSEVVRKSRKMTLELILSDHPTECNTCIRNNNCELQNLSESFGIRQVRFTRGAAKSSTLSDIDSSSPCIVRDPRKCILCRRCVAVCEKIQGIKAIGPVNRGFNTVIAPPFGKSIMDVNCSFCGQCALVCPTGAITEKDDTDKVWAALADPSKHVVVQTAPATRVALPEEFGMDPGTIGTGKMVAALKRLGFAKVFDTDFSADLTIMEEGTELIHRITNGGVLPMITSCSPGWIKYIEHYYPELLPHLSTCKSPQQMMGAVIKTYYAQKAAVPAENIVSVSIMPCTAKKFEAQRDEMNGSGFQDVDIVITTRELARMCREAGIDWENIPEETYDDPLGKSTGAAVLFGATGGVMEAALRTAYEIITKETLENIDFTMVRGMEGIKEATIKVGDLDVKVAVAHTLGNARKLLDLIKQGKADYHFIEVMCCPGGCIGGGGQPIPTNLEVRLARMAGTYKIDSDMPLRKSHENPSIKEIYADFLGSPLGELSHKLLHTHYTPRGVYRKPE